MKSKCLWRVLKTKREHRMKSSAAKRKPAGKIRLCTATTLLLVAFAELLSIVRMKVDCCTKMGNIEISVGYFCLQFPCLLRKYYHHTLFTRMNAVVENKLLCVCVQPDFRTSADCVGEWQGSPMKTKLGLVTCSSLKSAPIKWWWLCELGKPAYYEDIAIDHVHFKPLINIIFAQQGAFKFKAHTSRIRKEQEENSKIRHYR